MTDSVGDKKFGVVSYVIVRVGVVGGGGCAGWGGGEFEGIYPPETFSIFPPLETRFHQFSETDFWMYSVTFYYNRPNILHDMFM